MTNGAMRILVPTHERSGLMVHGGPPSREAGAFLSWRFVLIAVAMLGAVGAGIATFALSTG